MLIEILREGRPINPRNTVGNMGWMACWAPRWHKWGDEQPLEGPLQYIAQKLGPAYHSLANWDGMHRLFEEAQKQWCLLHLYRGREYWIESSVFLDLWDKDWVGLIYVPWEEVRKNLDWTELTEKRRTSIERTLEGEVKRYALFLQGEVYRFEVKDAEGRVVDHGGGFYGADYRLSGMAAAFPPEWTEKDVRYV